MVSGSPIVQSLRRAESRRMQTKRSNQAPSTPTQEPTTPIVANTAASTETVAPSPRRTQYVLPFNTRARIIRWMVEKVGRTNSTKFIASRAVRQFPSFFRSNQNANLTRAAERQGIRISVKFRSHLATHYFVSIYLLCHTLLTNSPQIVYNRY